MIKNRFTSETIDVLKSNEIFVFGSNLSGKHYGGSAKVAVDKFGAIMCQGVGRQGQSYAIPTLDENFQRLNILDICDYLDGLAFYAIQHPKLTFYLTKIGCGIAGFSIDEIRSAVQESEIINCRNIILPKEFSI